VAWTGNSKAKDNSFKLIFEKPELFIEFLQDYIRDEQLSRLFADLQPSDIEDISERLLPLFQDGKDNDTIKRVHIKGDVPLFVITVLEHESKVNHRASFKMLQYIALVLHEYEKDADSKKAKASFAKNFKYPPILPIVFYDGTDNWTAEKNFVNKTELCDVFYKYIPKFEYELVCLKDYSQSDLVQFGNTLSMIMIMDKIRRPGDISRLKDLPDDYAEKLKLNIPPPLTRLIADVVTVLLKRINVPEDEINAVTEVVYQRRYEEMFTSIENYDVQETRRIAAEEGREEGVAMGVKRGREEERKTAIRNMMKRNLAPETIGEFLGISTAEVKRLMVD
jgi:hypothetical protein